MAGLRFYYAFTAEKLVVGDVADLADKAEDEALQILTSHNGRIEEKIVRQILILIFYITLDTLSYTGKDFQRSKFIIIMTK